MHNNGTMNHPIKVMEQAVKGETMARTKAEMNTPENADPNEVDMDAETLALLQNAPEDWVFDTVLDQSPTQVDMEKPGDTFIGQYVEVRHIKPDKGGDEFDLIIFTGRDDNPYSMAPSYKLEKAFMKPEAGKEIPTGTWCRITLVQLIDTGSKQPLKDYKVEAKRA
jgi:hypothetical protein